jgi:hypothetical protein
VAEQTGFANPLSGGPAAGLTPSDAGTAAATERDTDRQGKAERRARRLYLWLLLSAFITVPWMFLGLISPLWVLPNAPRWSPDGRQIAYEDRGIWVISAGGFQRTQLVDGYMANCPAWSPDGKRIAYYLDSNTGPNAGSLWVIRADGSGAVRLADARTGRSGDCPSWSPDGSRIAYSTDSVFTGLPGDANPWSDSVFTIQADGAGRVTLGTGSCPVWSPDGKRIAFSSHIVNPDGSGLTILPIKPDLSWSPDGGRIAFSDGSRTQVVNVDGSALTFLGAGNDPSFSPDGRSVAYANGRGLYVTRLDGSGSMQISSRLGGTYQRHASWRPDGGSLVYPCAFYLPDLPIGNHICVVTSDGRETRILTAFGSLTLALVAPGLVHLVLLFGLLSPLLYVRRHAQQALVLALLRTLSPLAIVYFMAADMRVWVCVNGSLWLFGSVWGLRQVRQGDCLMMRLRGESAQLPRPWAAERPDGQESPKPAAAAIPAPGPANEAQAAFDQGLAHLAHGRQAEATACFMEAFRSGDEELRRRALAELDRLDQVDRG